jgi:signal transduction histidine kinase
MGPIRSGSQVVGVLLVVQDVTQIKLAQQELFGAQRLAAIGTLAAGVAHEINTPIQFVGDNVEFLREAARDAFDVLAQLQSLRDSLYSNPSAQQLKAAADATLQAEQSAELDYLKEHIFKAVDSCAEGLGRVTSIVRSMKEFSHPSQKDMAPADLNRAVSATLTVARSEYKYLADVETSFGELPMVTCYINDINQVVLNVLINAAHAIADAHPEGERGTIAVRTYVEGRNAVIAIRDTGNGIPEEVRPRIFEPFFTTKEVGRGTGQGLAIAWTAVKEKHGGDISFETKLGVGTCFYIRLPIAGRVAEGRPSRA